MRSAGVLCTLTVCHLLGQATAFIASSARHPTSSQVVVGTKASATSSSLAVGNRVPTQPAARGLVMAAGVSPRESSVAVYKKYVGNKWEAMGMTEKRASATFDEISSIYGEDNAVKMVKAVPGCLGYNPDNFKGTFDAFSDNFGAEETIGMVTRNPNLLSVRPTGFGGAMNAKGDTMTFSYLIAFTRPLGPFLLYGLLLALALPVVEIATGIPRGQMISAVASKLGG